MTTLVQPTPHKIETPHLPQGDSCLVVIFGGSGDLTRRKLIPALYDLACVGCTNRNFEVLGIGRTKFDDEDYRSRLRQSAATSQDARNFTDQGWDGFAQRLHYFVGDADRPDFYPLLKAEDRGDAEERRQQERYCSMFPRPLRSRHRLSKAWAQPDWPITAKAGRASSWKSLLAAISRAPRS